MLTSNATYKPALNCMSEAVQISPDPVKQEPPWRIYPQKLFEGL